MQARLRGVLDHALSAVPFDAVSAESGPLPDLRGRRVLFAMGMGEYGMDEAQCRLLMQLRRDENAMEGACAALLVDGQSELYTKQFARMLAFCANRAGCALPGKALVEATGSMQNWAVQAEKRGVGLEEAYRIAAAELVQRLMRFTPPQRDAAQGRPRLLVLHASDRRTSNTLALGEALCTRLAPHCDIRELSLQNGAIFDCRGCSYKTCSHFAKQNACFYGGSIVEEVYPALMDCDALLLLCPNYNDALSANFTAFINRLTALLVYNGLYDKYLYAVVVSGYSGGDIVAEQLLGAMCFNKTFMLPPRFSFLVTANAPGTAMHAPRVEEKLDAFAAAMRDTLCVRSPAHSAFPCAPHGSIMAI